MPADRDRVSGAVVHDAHERGEQARVLTLRQDGAREIGTNLEEGASLSLAATTLAQAFTTQ